MKKFLCGLVIGAMLTLPTFALACPRALTIDDLNITSRPYTETFHDGSQNHGLLITLTVPTPMGAREFTFCVIRNTIYLHG